MAAVDWIERQHRWIVRRPVRAWLAGAALIGGWIASVHALVPGPGVTWPIVLIDVLGLPTIAVGAALLRERRRRER